MTESAGEKIEQILAEAAIHLAEPDKVEVEYAVFNDPEVWEPLFASGELHESQRFQLDEPLHSGLSLWSVYRFASLRNQERGEQDKIGKYGFLKVLKRTVTTTPYTEVTYEEIDEVRR